MLSTKAFHYVLLLKLKYQITKNCLCHTTLYLPAQAIHFDLSTLMMMMPRIRRTISLLSKPAQNSANQYCLYPSTNFKQH